MSATTGIIDTLSTVPLVSLQQVLDLNGPYGPGDYTLSDFRTDGAFLLPAGTYSISGVYGVLLEITRIPVQAGITFGWNDPTFPIASGDWYADRMAQVCLLRTFPITGATVITDVYNVHLVQQLFLWPALVGPAAKIGLHVNPNFECDLYFMCVL
jgi:hypothetical protein